MRHITEHLVPLWDSHLSIWCLARSRRLPISTPHGKLPLEVFAMKLIVCLLLGLLLTAPGLAVQNRRRSFSQGCDSVWTAAVVVAKGQEYRIVSISKEEQIISLVAGGAWNGERVITVSLAPGIESGCMATVQSRFSGLAHSDGPDLLARISVQVIGQTVDRNSKAFRHYKRCVEYSYNDSISGCDGRLQKELAKQEFRAPGS
jgi:hypothetical protein